MVYSQARTTRTSILRALSKCNRSPSMSFANHILPRPYASNATRVNTSFVPFPVQMSISA